MADLRLQITTHRTLAEYLPTSEALFLIYKITTSCLLYYAESSKFKIFVDACIRKYLDEAFIKQLTVLKSFKKGIIYDL